jgi:hypothetical protein
MQVDVDTRSRGGEPLPAAGPAAFTYKTEVFDALDQLANARVKQIIAANGGAAVRSQTAAAR